MNPVLLLLLLLVGYSDDTVVTLDVDTYHPFLDSHSEVLVKYYTSWCQHCKQLAPVYVETALEVTKQYPNVVFAEIDVGENPKIGRELQLRGVPTLIFFKDGKSLQYEGKPSQEGITQFVKSVATTSIDNTYKEYVKSKVAELRKSISSHASTVVAYCNDSSYDYVRVLDNALQDVVNLTRLLITDSGVAREMNAPFPGIVMYRDSGESATYQGDLSKDALLKWVLIEELPLIVPYTVSYSRKMFDSRHDIHLQLLFFAPESSSDAKTLQYRQVLERIARKYRGVLFVSHIPSENPRLLDYYGIRSWQVPTIGLAHFVGKRMDKYYFEDEFSEQMVALFIDNFLKGVLKPALRSEEEPRHNTGPVYTIVGKTFESLVYDPEKDVVVKYHASWDGKSSDLAPVFEEAANHFAGDKGVLFGAVDIMKNEMNGIEISEFPKIIMYKAGGNGRESVEFAGEMSLEEIIAFVDKNRRTKPMESDEL